MTSTVSDAVGVSVTEYVCMCVCVFVLLVVQKHFKATGVTLHPHAGWRHNHCCDMVLNHVPQKTEVTDV